MGEREAGGHIRATSRNGIAPNSTQAAGRTPAGPTPADSSTSSPRKHATAANEVINWCSNVLPA